MVKHESQWILDKLKSLDKEVKQSLKTKGLVSARKTQDGSILVGKFKIRKNQDGLYFIEDQNNYIIVDKINLPHTAAILANKLALGQWTDREILDLDRKYGHHSFDEQLCKLLHKKNSQIKNYFKADILNEKFHTAKLRKEFYRKQIILGFNKLLRIS